MPVCVKPDSCQKINLTSIQSKENLGQNQSCSYKWRVANPFVFRNWIQRWARCKQLKLHKSLHSRMRPRAESEHHRNKQFTICWLTNSELILLSKDSNVSFSRNKQEGKRHSNSLQKLCLFSSGVVQVAGPKKLFWLSFPPCGQRTFDSFFFASEFHPQKQRQSQDQETKCWCLRSAVGHLGLQQWLCRLSVGSSPFKFYHTERQTRAHVFLASTEMCGRNPPHGLEVTRSHGWNSFACKLLIAKYAAQILPYTKTAITNLEGIPLSQLSTVIFFAQSGSQRFTGQKQNPYALVNPVLCCDCWDERCLIFINRRHLEAQLSAMWFKSRVGCSPAVLASGSCLDWIWRLFPSHVKGTETVVLPTNNNADALWAASHQNCKKSVPKFWSCAEMCKMFKPASYCSKNSSDNWLISGGIILALITFLATGLLPTQTQPVGAFKRSSLSDRGGLKLLMKRDLDQVTASLPFIPFCWRIAISWVNSPLVITGS